MTVILLVTPVILIFGLLLQIEKTLILEPKPRNLDQMIPYVTSIDESMAHFERLLEIRSDDSDCDERVSELEDKKLYHQRLCEILEILEKFGHNTNLFRAVARHEIQLLVNPETYGDYGQVICELFNGTTKCRLFIFLAKLCVRACLIATGTRWFVAFPQSSASLRFLGLRILDRYGEIRALALNLASRHGEHYYDNLLCAL